MNINKYIYRCSKPCNTRYKKEEVHQWITNFFGSITLKPEVKDLIFKMIQERFEEQTKTTSLSPKHFEKVKIFEDKLIRLQDLYIEDEIDKDAYYSSKNRYEKILNDLNQKTEHYNNQKLVLETYENGLSKLQYIDKQFDKATLEDKRQLLGSIFQKNFQFKKNHVRTADINPILLKISSVNKGFERNKKRDKSKNIDLSQYVLKVGIEPTLPKKLDFESSASTNSAT